VVGEEVLVTLLSACVLLTTCLMSAPRHTSQPSRGGASRSTTVHNQHTSLFKTLQERNAHHLSYALPLSNLNIFNSLLNSWQSNPSASKNPYLLNFLYSKLESKHSALFFQYRPRDLISLLHEILRRLHHWQPSMMASIFTSSRAVSCAFSLGAAFFALSLYHLYMIVQRMERRKIYVVRSVSDHLMKQHRKRTSSDHLTQLFLKRRQGLMDLGLK